MKISRRQYKSSDMVEKELGNNFLDFSFEVLNRYCRFHFSVPTLVSCKAHNFNSRPNFILYSFSIGSFVLFLLI